MSCSIEDFENSSFESDEDKPTIARVYHDLHEMTFSEEKDNPELELHANKMFVREQLKKMFRLDFKEAFYLYQ